MRSSKPEAEKSAVLEIEAPPFPNFESKYPLPSNEGRFLARVLYSTAENESIPQKLEVTDDDIVISTLTEKGSREGGQECYRAGRMVKTLSDMHNVLRPQLEELENWVVSSKGAKYSIPLIEETELKKYFDRANSWVDKNPGLIENRAECLHVFSRMLLAFHIPDVVDGYRQTRINRLKEIGKAIAVFDKYGVLVENEPIGNRGLWIDAWKEIQFELRFRYQKDKYARYQPALTDLSCLLHTTLNWGKNRVLYTLFEEFEVLQNLFAEIYMKHRTMPKRRILTQLSKDISRYAKLKRSYTMFMHNYG